MFLLGLLAGFAGASAQGMTDPAKQAAIHRKEVAFVADLARIIHGLSG